MKIAVVTVSDRSFRGERNDASGPLLSEKIMACFPDAEVLRKTVPDEREAIGEMLRSLVDIEGTRLVLTTGGTGLAPRDVTPEATLEVIERRVPGIPEMIRVQSLRHTPFSALSRGEAGIRGESLIVNLPGSPKAAAECFDIVAAILPHALELTAGSVTDCAR